MNLLIPGGVCVLFFGVFVLKPLVVKIRKKYLENALFCLTHFCREK